MTKKDDSTLDPGDKTVLEQTMPEDTTLTVEIEDYNIPCLFSQLVVDGKVLDHHAVVQRQEIPEMEHEPDLDLVIQPSPLFNSPSDPNAKMTHTHILAPLAERASNLERSMINGPSESEHDETWTEFLEKTEQESPLPLSAMEHRHLMTMKLDRMGTLQPTSLLYPEAMTHTAEPDETPFTTLEYTEVDTEESIDIPSCPPPSGVNSAGANSTRSTVEDPSVSSESSTVTVPHRRHHRSMLLPLMTILRYCSTIWLSDFVTTSFATPGIHHSALVYVTMMTLADFIEPETLIWNCVHAWVTNSTIPELIFRLILFGSDSFTVNEILLNSETRARAIANSRTCLSTLIGRNINLMADEPINGTLFLQQQQTLVPRWRRVALAFQRMNFGLKELKYDPTTDDPFYRADPNSEMGRSTTHKIATAKSVLQLGAFALQKRFMSLPTIAVIYPVFRTTPRKWVILANQLTVALELDDPAVISLLVESNASLFSGCLLSSKMLQMFGIYNELMADANNRTWRGRKLIPAFRWNHSYTHYDADFQPISTNNSVTQPVPKYVGKVSSDMHILENLIWLISSNKDQSLIMLHQYQQGSHLGACPRMGNMVATATDETWTHDQLMENTVCTFYHKYHFNNWMSCNRRAAMINLHPGLVFVRRQHWYLVKIVAKYAINPYTSALVFSGHPGATTTEHTYTIPHVSLPKELQTKKYITHGNECLTDSNGYGIGTHVILNSGCMSHGCVGGDTTGLSKALCMALVLFISPLTEDQPLNFAEAWFALNVSNLPAKRLELLCLLNAGVTRHFWTLKKVDGAGTLAAKWPTQLTYMSGNCRNLETELIIGFDNVAHAIQKALNVNNITDERTSTISIDRYQVDNEAIVSYPDDHSLTDGMPNMAAPFPLYYKEVLHQYNSSQEEDHYERLRDLFKSQFQIFFTNLHETCKWDFAMVKLIYTIWEVCQMHGCAISWNGVFGQYSRNRCFFTVMDFRVSADVVLQMVTRFMDYCEQPFPSYRMKPEYAKIISSNPVGGGRLFKDKNGRPSDNQLAVIYLGISPNMTQAEDWCARMSRLPGKCTLTTMDAEYDPYYEHEHMRAQDNQ